MPGNHWLFRISSPQLVPASVTVGCWPAFCKISSTSSWGFFYMNISYQRKKRAEKRRAAAEQQERCPELQGKQPFLGAVGVGAWCSGPC